MRDYIGNCIDSFDEDGDCIFDCLPWNTVSDFACDMENGDNCIIGNVEVVYDAETDVHSFYKIG